MATSSEARKFETSPVSQRNCKKYKLDKHCLDLGGRLNCYRRYGNFCDVKLVVKGTEFNAHRVVLAGCGSEYFYNLFTVEMKEKQEGVVHFERELESDIMEEFLYFIYTGQVTLTSENAVKLLKAANYTNVPRLKSLCEDFLQETLTVEQYFTVRKLAEMYDCPQLFQTCDGFIKAHFTELAKLPEFLDISESELEYYLTSDDIVVKGEEEVYETLIRWVRHKLETRKKHFYKLFCCIRLPSLSNHFIKVTVAEEDLVCNDCSCLKKLALKTLSRPDSLPKPRKCTDNFLEAIVVCGGDDMEYDVNNQCVCYVPSSGEWFKLSSMPCLQVLHHGSTESDGLLYVMGGQTNYTNMPNSTAYRYDPILDKWLSIAPLLIAAFKVGVVALMGYVYVVGGAKCSPCGALSVVQRYDPTTNCWQLVESLSTPREKACVVSDQQFLYAIGGSCQVTPGEDEILKSCEKYDACADNWLPIPSMSKRRINASSAVCNAKIYVLGGETDFMGTTTSSCEMYDISMETWSNIAPLQNPCTYGTAAAVDGQVFLLGGSGAESECMDEIVQYDEIENTWKVASFMPRNKYNIPSSVLRFSKNFLKNCPEMNAEDDDH